MRIHFHFVIFALILGLTSCNTQSNDDTVTDEPGILIWGGAPEVDGTGIIFETANTTYGVRGLYEDFEKYFPDDEYSVSIIADYHITGKIATRGWGTEFPEIILIEINITE